MRIRIVHKPRLSHADGIRLDVFEVGGIYEVGTVVGALMLAEQWAVPVADDDPAPVTPVESESTIEVSRRLTAAGLHDSSSSES